MHNGNIAGVEPLPFARRVFVHFEIAFDDPGTANFQSPRRHAVTRRDIAVFVDDAEFHAKGHSSLLADHIDLLIESQVIPVSRGRPHCSNRGCLGHAPGMIDANAHLHQPLYHEPWTRRAPNCHKPQLTQPRTGRVQMLEHREPYRGHAR